MVRVEESVLIPESIGELLDSSRYASAELLLSYAKQKYQQFDSLSVEHVNLLGGLVSACKEQHWLAVVDYALVLDAFLDTQGYWEEDKRNLELALDAVQELGTDYEERKAILLHDLAVILAAQAYYSRARDYFEQSLTLERKLGNQLAIARTLNYLGRLSTVEGDFDNARRFFEESLVFGERAGDDQGIGVTLHEIGTLYMNQGDYDRAQEYYDRCLNQSQGPVNTRDQASTLHQLGVLNYKRGDKSRAQSYFQRALLLDEEAAHQEGIARALFNLGQIANDGGDLPEARYRWTESLRRFEQLGMPEAKRVKERLSNLA
jgi:tetratricopeptide (TPR) repeat protein